MEVYRRYKNWVRRNGNILSVFETGLSSLTWVLPDRFNDNELTLEAMHTTINLLSAFHDSIINDAGPAAPPGASELTFALTALQQVEVLVELWGLWAQGRGKLENHYDPLIAVEGLKALVRLGILHSSRTRILAYGGATAFEPSPLAGLGIDAGRSTGGDARARQVFAAFAAFRARHCDPGEAEGATREGDSREQYRDAAGKQAQEEGKQGARRQFWWEEATQPRHLQAALAPGASPAVTSATALRALEGESSSAQAAAARLVITGEVLHILRPLLYVMALRRWGRRSWKPWAISLFLELSSARLTAAGATASRRAAARAARHPAVAGTSLQPLYALQGISWRRDEADELTRRKLLLLYYLARDPFFARFTRPAIERWEKRLGRLPLVGWLASKAAEVIVGAQKYYSYTAAS